MILDNVLVITTNAQLNALSGYRADLGFGINIGLGFIISLIIFYYNFVYIRKCFKNSEQIVQFIIAFFFGFWYTLFRWIFWGDCKKKVK